MQTQDFLSAKQTADLIKNVGSKRTVLVQGENGIGKTALWQSLAQQPEFDDHIKIKPIDCTQMSDGSIWMPDIDREHGVSRELPNERLGVSKTNQKGIEGARPVFGMFDEIAKIPQYVKNMIAPILYERRVGNYEMPEGSVWFAATNLSVEGLGDNVPPHALNRLTRVKVCKTNATTWIEDYAIPMGINPVIIGTVAEYPEMFATFEDYEKPEQNTYINDPRTVRQSVVTPRSMERASYVYERTRILGDDVMCHALAGTVGEKAMHNILTMDKMNSQLTPWDELVKSPETATVPTSAAASCMLVSKAVQRIDKDSIGAWMKFLNRIPKEAQGLFARSVMSDKCPKRDVAARNTEFAVWAAANNFLFAKK